MPAVRASLSLGVLLALAGCGESARLTVRDGMGPTPQLPAPVHALIPTVAIAPARGWPAQATPTAAPGLAVKGPANFESATTTVLIRERERATATAEGWIDIRLG